MTDADSGTGDEATEQVEEELLHGAPTTMSGRQQVVFPDLDNYLEVAGALCADGFEMCIDLCVVDYLTAEERRLPDSVDPERFEIVVNLLSLTRKERIRLRVQVPGEAPEAPTLTGIYPGTEAMEREAFDMFGVIFTGNPDLSRILLPEDWQGHPLRKDYSMGRIPVQFKAPEGRS